MPYLLPTCLVYIRDAIETFCARTNGGGVCSSDSRHVVMADRDAVDSTWSTVVFFCQIARLDVWSGPDYWTEINQACRMTETSALRVLRPRRTAWKGTQAVQTVRVLNSRRVSARVCVRSIDTQ